MRSKPLRPPQGLLIVVFYGVSVIFQMVSKMFQGVSKWFSGVFLGVFWAFLFRALANAHYADEVDAERGCMIQNDSNARPGLMDV